MTEPIKTSGLNEILLADIWRAFAIYDCSATNAQNRFFLLRLLILRLSVFVTFVAVAYSQIKTQPKDLILSVDQSLPYFSIFHGWVNFALEFVVILAPILVSILLAGTVKFGRGVNWILLRASAETIKQEIYLYRTQVGNYRDSTIRDINFAKEIQAINERLMKTQVNQAGLAWNAIKVNDHQSLRTTIQAAIAAQDKDPFSTLTAEQYLDYRLIDQLTWYRKKTLILDKKWQQLQWLIYILGGVGTFLAAMKLDVWITISNAIAASILSFLEFRRLDSTLIGYNQTATNLENILWWWYALTDEARTEPKNIEKLVESSERVIRSETTGWVQEMKDAMADLYKMDEDRLAKEAEDAKKAKEAEEAKKVQEAEDAKKAEDAQKNDYEKADGETKSVNMEEVPKQEGSGENWSSTDN
jgi:hypothetical protein